MPRSINTAAALLGVMATLLLSMNMAGFFVPIRAAEVNGYVDFADAATLSSSETLGALSSLKGESDSLDLASQATRIVHEGIAHIAPADVRRNGLEHYSMRVPVTENWVLFLLSYLKPSTYRDYEFCSYRRAIERGTGRCGQQALTLVGYLEERGFDTGFVALGGHAIATARTEEAGWVLLDPDYGGVIPFDLEAAEADPQAVLPHYWSEAATKNGIHRAYEAEHNRIKQGGVYARYPRACRIESIAYLVKWLAPIGLLGLVILLLRSSRKS